MWVVLWQGYSIAVEVSKISSGVPVVCTLSWEGDPHGGCRFERLTSPRADRLAVVMTFV